MIYAFVVEGEVVMVMDDLPLSIAEMTLAEQEALGYYKIVYGPTPENFPYPPPEDGMWENTIAYADGAVTASWSVRPFTLEEQVERTGRTNKRAIEVNLAADLALIQEILDDTNASINSNPAARIKVMGRAMRRLIRHQLEQFDGID